jgi:hypothetical protein
MKKAYPIIVVGIFLLSSIGASAVSNFNIDESIEWKSIESLGFPGNDELDQSQLLMDFFAPVGNIFLAPELNYISAQSFIPTKDILTRVEIKAGKNSTATYDFTLAIKGDLLGPDLTKLSLPPGEFVTENFSWVEFDFDDISVIPGNTYYIVASTDDEVDNWYAWGAQLSDVYSNGSVWWSENDGSSWEEDPDADLTFKTYGFDNSPPEDATLDGPSRGKVNTSYEFSMTANDPDGHDLIYCFDFGDGSGELCIGPFSNGETGYISHIFTEKGTYTITAKATDWFGAEGEPVTIEISIPRSKYNIFSFRLLNLLGEHIPNLFPVLRQLLGFL